MIQLLMLVALVDGSSMVPTNTDRGHCTALTISNPGEEPKPDPEIPEEERTSETRDIVTYKVKNTAAIPQHFVLTWDMQVYPRRTVPGNQEVEVAVHVPPAAEREFLANLPRNRGKSIQPQLQNCTTLRGYDKQPGAPISW